MQLREAVMGSIVAGTTDNFMAPRIAVNGVPLLDGQATAVEIAVARLEAELTDSVELDGDKWTAREALLTMVSEVRDLLRQGGS